MTTIETTETTSTLTRKRRFTRRTHKTVKIALKVLRDVSEQMAVTQGYLSETETDRYRERHDG
jgi:hypothetical protein